MKLLFNELSVHGQFSNFKEFGEALSRLMGVRSMAERFGCEVQCRRDLLYGPGPPSEIGISKVVGNLTDRNQQRAVRAWLTKGPFWDGVDCHDEEIYLECKGDIVNGTAVGEAAFRSIRGVRSGLLSICPSEWNSSPIEVIWQDDGREASPQVVRLGNWWCKQDLEDVLQRVPPTGSWNAFGKESAKRFGRLVFSDDCFKPLAGTPFSESAARRFCKLFQVLEDLSRAFRTDGARTEEWNQIYQMYFTGDKAWFSDSSDTEKRRFREALTFPHPVEGAGSLFCPWHGKVSYLHLRLHFSGIPKAGEPVYVVHVGPKLTKR